MIGCSLNSAEARARNLICCKSIISVLPPLIICNKFPPINLFYSSPSRINVDFYPTNSDNVGCQLYVELISKNSRNHKIIIAPSRIPKNSEKYQPCHLSYYFLFGVLHVKNKSKTCCGSLNLSWFIRNIK